jgi:putative flippase GtrA
MSTDVRLSRISSVPHISPDAAFPTAFQDRAYRGQLKPSRRNYEQVHIPARHASPSRAHELVDRHGARFTSFSIIGGAIFIAGLAFQAALTSGLHVPSFLSYVAQAVVSVEASFLLNRWITRGKRETAFWPSFWRYNLQQTVTVVANLVLYAGLLRLGMNYLLANVLLTAVFAVINYVGGGRRVRYLAIRARGTSNAASRSPFSRRSSGGDRYVAADDE